MYHDTTFTDMVLFFLTGAFISEKIGFMCWCSGLLLILNLYIPDAPMR